jgi:hypothetical protein
MSDFGSRNMGFFGGSTTGGGGSSTGVNGLNGTTNIGLGGTLTGNTTINGDNRGLTLGDDSSLLNYFKSRYSALDFQMVIGNYASAISSGNSEMYFAYANNNTGDSSIIRINDTEIRTQDRNGNNGLKLDFVNRAYTLGDYDDGYNGIKFIVDDTNQFIKTVNGSGDNGIIITNSFTFFGIRNNVQYLYFSIDYGLNKLALRTTNDISDGIELNLSSNIYKFGCYNLGTTFIQVDNPNTRISLNTEDLQFNGTGLQDNNAPTGLGVTYLLVTLNNVQYSILCTETNP